MCLVVTTGLVVTVALVALLSLSRHSVFAAVCASSFLADNSATSDLTAFTCVFSDTKALSHSL